MEWAILLLIVPIVVAPVVLLLGFSGCQLVFPLDDPDPQDVAPEAPVELVASALDIDQIRLTWQHMHPEPVQYHVTRTGGPNLPQPAPVDGLELLDSGLAEGTMYIYQVKAVLVSNPAVESQLSMPAGATTLSFEPVLDTTGLPPNPNNGQDAANDTLVQRISNVPQAAFLRLTLRGVAGQTAVLTAVTVSKAVPPASAEPWDSATVPVPVTFAGAEGVTITGDTTAVSDKIPISLSAGDAIHVAFNVDSGSGRVLRRDVAGAVAFTGNNRAEAGLDNRTAGYNTDNDRVYCIEKLELA